MNRLEFGEHFDEITTGMFTSMGCDYYCDLFELCFRHFNLNEYDTIIDKDLTWVFRG